MLRVTERRGRGGGGGATAGLVFAQLRFLKRNGAPLRSVRLSIVGIFVPLDPSAYVVTVCTRAEGRGEVRDWGNPARGVSTNEAKWIRKGIRFAGWSTREHEDRLSSIWLAVFERFPAASIDVFPPLPRVFLLTSSCLRERAGEGKVGIIQEIVVARHTRASSNGRDLILSRLVSDIQNPHVPSLFFLLFATRRQVLATFLPPIPPAPSPFPSPPPARMEERVSQRARLLDACATWRRM